MAFSPVGNIRLFLSACVAMILLHSAAMGQSDALASKNIPLVFGVADRIFAFSDITFSGQSFSSLDLLKPQPSIKNGAWPWPGGAQGGVTWGQKALVLRSDVGISDSIHVARVASLDYDGGIRRSDSLLLPLKDSASANSLARGGAGLTAMAIWHDTLILGFGRLGIAYAKLAPETGDSLFSTNTLAFSVLPSRVDSTLNLATCVWKKVCRVDTLHVPVGGLDSVIALAVDSSAPDSIWLLVATESGLRRGPLGGGSFPRVSLPGLKDSVAVQRLAASPSRNLLWAFTSSNPPFFSGDHGATFHLPDTIPGISTPPSILISDANPPQSAFSGDTTFVNFNLLDRPGLVIFEKDSLRRSDVGDTLFSDVLIDREDGLGIVEGSPTTLAVASDGNSSILVVGTSKTGLYYRRLDNSGAGFVNLNRLRTVKGSLKEVITFPTLFGVDFEPGGEPTPVKIGYGLKANGKVTITVFNHAMEKVRTVVKSAPRFAGARSEKAGDEWDGKDSGGRYVSVGTYYILVESDQGERGFGKAISVRGRK